MQLQNYIQKKNEIHTLLDDIKLIANELSYSTVENDIIQSMVSLQEDKFQLAVVGEFSRGKSTFINALLGETILPAMTRPTTSIINKITYSETPKFILHYKDNNKTEILDKDEFKKITAPKEPDPDDKDAVKLASDQATWIDSIDHALVCYPLRFCKAGVEIIDTPGTNDLNTTRVDITYRYLNKADAVILILSATQALSKSELDFLHERILGNQIDKVFIVINFKDSLSSKDDEKKILDYVHGRLKDELPNPKLFLVSGKQALTFRRKKNGEEIKRPQDLPNAFSDTGFIEFEDHLADYLNNDCTLSKLRKYIHRGLLYSDNIINDILLVNIKSYRTSITELELQVKELEPKFKKVSFEANRLRDDLERNLRSSEFELNKIIEQDMPNILFASLAALNNCTDLNNIAQEMQQATAPLQKELLHKIEGYQATIISNHLNLASEQIRNIWDDVIVGEQKAIVAVNTELVSTVNISTNALETIAHNDEIEDWLIFGGAALAVFSAPLLAVAGFFWGDKINNFIKEIRGGSRDEKQRKYIREQIENHHAVEMKHLRLYFKQAYQTAVNNCLRSFDNQINNKIAEHRKQMQIVINEKKKAQIDTDAQIKHLELLYSRLETNKLKLSEVINE